MRYQCTSFELLKELLNHIPADDSCMEWPRGHKREKSGYGDLRFNGKNMLVHRVAYELTFGEIPDGLDVLHRCDNPICFRPSHLFTGTQLENMRDCAAKGRIKAVCRLTPEDVRTIRAEYAAGTRRYILARRYRVSWTNIQNILIGKIWKHT